MFFKVLFSGLCYLSVSLCLKCCRGHGDEGNTRADSLDPLNPSLALETPPFTYLDGRQDHAQNRKQITVSL